ncbi:hypothetical protein Peur_056785 [Populus x canadensis]
MPRMILVLCLRNGLVEKTFTPSLLFVFTESTSSSSRTSGIMALRDDNLTLAYKIVTEDAEWCEVKHTRIGASWYFFHGEKYKSCREVDDLDSEASKLLNQQENTNSTPLIAKPVFSNLNHHFVIVMVAKDLFVYATAAVF